MLAISLLKEFNKAFGIDSPDSVRLVDLNKMDVRELVFGHSQSLAGIGKVLHKDAKDYDAAVCLLRMQLMTEELAEVGLAISQGDPVQVLQELADLYYVVVGTAVAFGLGDKLEEAVVEVHRANMSKLGGGVDASGRVLKGKNFRKADIRSILYAEVQS